MNDFLPTSIVELQNTLTPKNIEWLKQDFIKRNFIEDEPPNEIDYDKGILYSYSSERDSLVGKKFEIELKDILWKAINQIKVEIDLSRIKLNDKERVLFWDEILSSIDKLRETSKKLLVLFPVINNAFNEIDNYLLTKYNYQTEEFFNVGFFTLKDGYTKEDVIKVFRFLTRNDYINGVEYSKKDFNSILFDSYTETTIEFNVFTYVIVFVLENLSKLFIDLTPKKIGESGRFKTKPTRNKKSEILSADNYGRAKNSIQGKRDNQYIIKIDEFFKLNFPN